MTKGYSVVVLGPNGPELWPVDRLWNGDVEPMVPVVPDPVVITPVVEPTPTPTPVPVAKVLAGEPRRLVGKNGSDAIYECTINGISGLIQVVNDAPDAFVPRGYNLNYEAIGEKPTGASSTNYGNDALPGFTRPAGYRKRYFGDKRLYYEQAEQADEADPNAAESKPEPVAKPQPASGPALGVDKKQLTVYEREPAGQFKPEQFGTGDYYDPNFLFSVDFNADRSLEQRRAVGENLIQISSLTDALKAALQRGEAVLYYTESSLHGNLEGPGYYESSLQEYLDGIYNRVIWAGGQGADKAVKLVVLNIEISNWWSKEAYGWGGHWTGWEGAKNKRIQCEQDGQWRTIEELDNAGLMEREQNVRRGNRLALLFALLHERAAPEVLMSYGSSMWQSEPDLSQVGQGSPFIESFPDVRFIGGDADGNITLKRPDGTPAHYKLTGNQYQNEDVMCGYYYRHTYDIDESDARRIWNDGGRTLTYADLWAVMKPVNIVADEKGYIQMCEEMMQRRYGKTHPILRMWEPVYEDNMATRIDGQPVEAYARTPFAQQRTANARESGYGDVPKIWQPPYLAAGRYMVTRFRAGAEKGWGTHIFPAGPANKLAGLDWYNQLLHSYTAVYQVRKDMQVLERWYEGSTLVENPEVWIDGAWKALTGPEAYGLHGGVRDAPKAGAMLRFKETDTGGTTVAIVAGTGQGYTEETECRVRFGGNAFVLPLCGPKGDWFLFEVGAGVTGRTFAGEAVKSPAGYYGRVA